MQTCCRSTPPHSIRSVALSRSSTRTLRIRAVLSSSEMLSPAVWRNARSNARMQSRGLLWTGRACGFCAGVRTSQVSVSTRLRARRVDPSLSRFVLCILRNCRHGALEQAPCRSCDTDRVILHNCRWGLQSGNCSRWLRESPNLREYWAGVTIFSLRRTAPELQALINSHADQSLAAIAADSGQYRQRQGLGGDYAGICRG